METSITSDMFNYSFRPAMEAKLRLFAEHGFRYLHWCENWNDDVVYTRKEMRAYERMVEAAGLRCLDVHGAATENICIDAEDYDAQRTYIGLLRNRIEFCSMLGGDAVVIHPPRQGAPAPGRRIERSIRVLDAVRPLCEDLGIAIAVENCHASDDATLRAYFDRYPPEFVGFCFDSGHANINRDMDRLFKFGERLKALHLHDNGGEQDDHQPPFSGTIDWSRVMGWIRAVGYRKPINFEVAHSPELFEGTMEEFLDYTVASIRRAMPLLEKD